MKLYLIILFLVVAVLLLFFNITTLFHWNIGNVFSLQALSSPDEKVIFVKSQQSIMQLKLSDNQKRASVRLLQMYKARWRSASALEKTQIALEAYDIGHTLDNSSVYATNCLPKIDRMEAENFPGVLPGTISTPRWVDGRLVALLFSTPAITQTICLPVEGLYQITVVSRENVPPPIEITVIWDEWPVGHLSYGLGNGDWTAKTVKIVSSAGEHKVQLSFQNDFRDLLSGVDRNAMIDYIEIELLD